MRLMRFFVILIAVAVTLLFALTANMPASAQENPPVCGGNDLMAALASTDAAAYNDIINQARNMENGHSRFWKIERPGVPTSYLYGTIHMSDQQVTTLPTDVKTAITGSKAVALELSEVVDEKKMEAETIRNLSLLAFTDGRSLESVLNPSEIELLKKGLARYGMPYNATRFMKPWFVSVSIALPLCEVQRQKAGLKALDNIIARTGLAAGAEVVGLEQVNEQFAAFDALPIDDQKSFLMSALRMSDVLDDQIETMKQLYLKSRIAEIWEFTRYLTRKYALKGQSLRDLEALDRFNTFLLERRNRVMIERALPLLAKGNTFIAVGALHLPGDSGLVKLIRNAGYTVTAIY